MKAPEPLIKHVIEASDKITKLLNGFTKSSFSTDERTQLAIIKLLEIIGEACSHLQNDYKRKHPNIPWPQIISMRNRLTHAYWDIDLDIVWKTATKRVPELQKQLQKL